MDVKSLSSNWKKLQEKLKTDNVSVSPKKRKITTPSSSNPSDARNGVNKKKRKSDGTSLSDSKQVKRYQDRPPSWKPHKMSEARRISAAGPATATEDAAVVTTVTATTTTTTTTTAKSRRNSTVSVHRVEPLRNGTVNEGRSPTAEVGKYIAMDCEMVGVGPNPDSDSALARVSIVNFNGDQVYDSYVRPKEMVTDWRTHVSGISPKHMVDARSLEQVQKDVAEILDGRVLVGHAVSNDLDALLFSHPKRDIRDTSKHAPYRKVAGGGSPRLKVLAAEFLGLTIQEGAHSSVEDARATMMLYRRDKEAFERDHAKKWPVRVTADSKDKGDGDQKKKKKKKKTRKR